jgi:hypothetical protein
MDNSRALYASSRVYVEGYINNRYNLNTSVSGPAGSLPGNPPAPLPQLASRRPQQQQQQQQQQQNRAQSAAPQTPNIIHSVTPARYSHQAPQGPGQDSAPPRDQAAPATRPAQPAAHPASPEMDGGAPDEARPKRKRTRTRKRKPAAGPASGETQGSGGSQPVPQQAPPPASGPREMAGENVINLH